MKNTTTWSTNPSKPALTYKWRRLGILWAVVAALALAAKAYSDVCSICVNNSYTTYNGAPDGCCIPLQGPCLVFSYSPDRPGCATGPDSKLCTALAGSGNTVCGRLTTTSYPCGVNSALCGMPYKKCNTASPTTSCSEWAAQKCQTVTGSCTVGSVGFYTLPPQGSCSPQCP